MNNKKVVLAGGSGFIGGALASVLVEQDYEVIILTRSPCKPSHAAIREIYWDGKTIGNWTQSINGAEAVVNLTGKSVNCRHSPENRREIVKSRIDSVRALAAAIGECEAPPKAWIQASGIGMYGNSGASWCEENAAPGDDFMAKTCLLWEGALNSVSLPATRKVILRIGFASGRDGGALPMLTKLTTLFLGGSVGNGRQFISWIHIQDLTRMFVWAIEREDLTGVFNATGPNPVTNAEFMSEMRRALRRPWSPPVPTWAAHLGAWLIGTEPSLALTGTRVVPKRFIAHGFDFHFPDLPKALNHLFRR